MARLRNVVKILAFAYLVIWGLIWIASPSLTRMVLADVLASQQLELDENSSVRLNIFLSCLTVHDLKWRNSQNRVFQLDELEACYSLHRLILQQAYLDHLILTGLEAQVTIDEQGILLAGFELAQPSSQAGTEPAPDHKEEQPSQLVPLDVLAPEITLKDLHINLNHLGNPHSLYIEKVQLDHTRIVEQVLHSELDLTLTLNEAKLQLRAELELQPAEGQLQLNLALTEFDPKAYQYLLPAPIEILSAKIGVTTQAEVAFAEGKLTGTSAAAIQVTDLNYGDDQLQAQLQNYQLNFADITLAMTEQEPVQVSAGFDSTLQRFSVDASNGKGQLLSLDKLKLIPSRIQVKGSELIATIPQLTLKGIQASTRHIDEDEILPPMVQLDQLTLSNLELTEASLNLESMELGEILAQVQRGAQGEITSLVLPGAANETPAVTKAPEVKADVSEVKPGKGKGAFAITLNELRLSQPATITFNDLSLTPKLAKQVTLEQLQVTGVDSNKPEQPAEFKVKLKDEEYFDYQLSGQIRPFSEKVNLSFESKATEFPLYQISPYIREALGFDIQAGQLDSTVQGKIENDVLDTELVLHLRGATFDSGSGDAHQEDSDVIGQAAIPLDVALSMLKDDNGNIELTIPVDGNVQDPNFGMHYILGLVATKAVMMQAQDYLITTFLPYAQVIKVGMIAGSYALKVRFDDLLYQPGQIKPGPEQLAFIQQFQALIADKQELQVKLCGVSTPVDIGLVEEVKLSDEQKVQLLDIAKQRAASFEEYLVEQGTDSARLLLCVPAYEQGKQAKPKLMLSV